MQGKKKEPHLKIERLFSEKDISSECINFLRKALTIDYKKRKSANQLLKHKWLAKFGQKSSDKMALSDKLAILQRIHFFSLYASNFTKMVQSLAIGFELD